MKDEGLYNALKSRVGRMREKTSEKLEKDHLVSTEITLLSVIRNHVLLWFVLRYNRKTFWFGLTPLIAFSLHFH